MCVRRVTRAGGASAACARLRRHAIGSGRHIGRTNGRFTGSIRRGAAGVGRSLLGAYGSLEFRQAPAILRGPGCGLPLDFIDESAARTSGCVGVPPRSEPPIGRLGKHRKWPNRHRTLVAASGGSPASSHSASSRARRIAELVQAKADPGQGQTDKGKLADLHALPGGQHPGRYGP